ncbi:MAG: type II toxin-antitoxin system RelE/ParE family toxin [Deltaproteobacteria bacterium]
MRKLKIPDETAELIRGMHPDLKKKIRASLQFILSDPSIGKPLKDDLSGLWSSRVGGFRIIYRVADDRIIEIVAIGPRESIYEETFKLLQQSSNLHA